MGRTITLACIIGLFAMNWTTEDELNDAITALSRRISSLQAKSVATDIETDSVKIQVHESAFQNTIREVFGADSREFEEYGHVDMLQGPLRVGMSRGEIIQARLRGRDYMVSILAELIGRLQDKILDLRRKIERGAIPTPDDAGLHPVVRVATERLIASGHMWEAAFAAGKALILHVKELSGRDDLDGAPLMRTVFSRKNPVLKFNALQTQTDMDEQEGMMHLYEGAVMAIRNPGGHEFPDGPEARAKQYIQLLSLLASRADEAER